MCNQFSEITNTAQAGLPESIGLRKRNLLLNAIDQFEKGAMTRRRFVNGVTSLVGASAASALLAACVVPAPEPPAAPEGVGAEGSEDASAAGLQTSMVTYGGSGQPELKGHLAIPAATPAPAVLVIQEWWGLNPHIKDVANRFAQAGFVALAPDLYHGEVATEPTEARKLAMALDRSTALTELNAAAQYLLDLDSTSGETVGIVGFCLGGGIAQAFAVRNPLNGAAISFYGSPLSDEDAAQVNSALLTIWGAEDGAYALPRTEQLEQALTTAGVTNRRLVYEGAGHSFFNDTRASYHAEAAQDAWQQSLEWFTTYLEG